VPIPKTLRIRSEYADEIKGYVIVLTTGEKLIKNHRFEIIEAAS